ncbi:hypothetical protein JTE90_013980 [Oedothorax gibbosus]|uniref:Gustatory receptor n=1 Tax=Oedothorax gibbosus TaxID=931172 RepID=A0AAV6UDB6_9ARAC|nr:hypothetical protein JTE90_013980 [Oedothorax gibbosus]
MHITLAYVVYQFCVGYAIPATTIAYTCSCTIPIAIWYSSYGKRNLLRSLFVKFNRMKARRKNKSNYQPLVINIALSVTFLATFVPATVLAIFLFSSNKEATVFYSFNNISKQNQSRYLVSFTISNLFLMTQITFPSIITILCCVVYHKCGDLFKPLLEQLENYRVDKPRQYRMNHLLQKYQDLYKLTHQVEKTVKTTSFMVLVSHMLNMYLNLANYVIERDFAIWEIAEFLPVTFLSPTLVVAMVLCGSRITTQVKEMQYHLQIILCDLKRAVNRDMETLEMVKIMLDTKFTTMSAGGMVQFTPGLVLSVFGSLLSFGLLMLNITISSVDSIAALDPAPDLNKNGSIEV